jgi:SAM-dependent methyltransferase
MKKAAVYEKLAAVYNHVMRKVRYEDWADYLFTITNDYIARGAKVLELAGGNCQLGNYLAGYYPDLIVTDSSLPMLQQDYIKGVQKVCCDMISLPFKCKFDLVYCTFDSINYLTSVKKLQKLFNETASVLSDKGIFTFDVSLERNSLIHIQQPVRKGKIKDASYIHHSVYDAGKRIHKNIFTITFSDNTIYREIHKQKIYPFEEYFRLIEKAGMYVVNCFEAFTFKNAGSSSVRAQFIVAKHSTGKNRKEQSYALDK